MGIAVHCRHSIHVDFANLIPDILAAFGPETYHYWDEYGEDLIEFAHSAEHCQKLGIPCEEHVEEGVLDMWDACDKNAWMQGGQPPVTGNLLVSLLKALSAPA